MSSFQSLNLVPQILQALQNKGYVDPTPIQAQAIPHLLEKKDLLGIAQTGTGKTAAFSLPILNNLAKNPRKPVAKRMRVLILTPTRELASQIADNINEYSKGLGLKHVVIFGGVGENPQISAMQKGVDIVIATPGRLLDLTKQGFINYDNLEVFVLDEADRMLDMGFINDIKEIIRLLPVKRQNLLFSATMPSSITFLANTILKDPVRVEVTPQSTTVEKIEQKVLFVDKSNKNLLLKDVIEKENVKAALVFCRMKHSANKVEDFLNSVQIKAASIHGNKSQSAREKALQNFRDGKVQVLVATDIAARGIDIPSVTHVINYDLPQEPESYVHRIGRTARAGREGVAIAFCDPLEKPLLKAVEKAIKRQILVDNNHAYFGVEGVSLHRKISSGKNLQKKFSPQNAAQPSKDNASQGFGRRIFAAKTNDSSLASARPNRNRDDENFAIRNSNNKNNNIRNSNNRNFEKQRRTDNFEEPRQHRKDGDFRRDGDSRREGDFKKHKNSDRYAKSTSKGYAFHTNKKAGAKRNAHKNSQGGRAGAGGQKTAAKKFGLGKLIKWFKGK